MKASFFLIAFLIIISSINTIAFEDTVEDENKSLELRRLRSAFARYRKHLREVGLVVIDTAIEDSLDEKDVKGVLHLISLMSKNFSKKDLVNKILEFVYENNVNLRKVTEKLNEIDIDLDLKLM